MVDWQRITIVSGGQTGADRAALDFAIAHGLAHGGWCPRGRLAEDGPIPSRYQLQETPSRRYAERTERNVRESDATVIFSISCKLGGGSGLTVQLANKLGKPWLHLWRNGRAADTAATQLLAILQDNQVTRLNVAGPRASQEPEVTDFVRAVFERAFARG